MAGHIAEIRFRNAGILKFGYMIRNFKNHLIHGIFVFGVLLILEFVDGLCCSRVVIHIPNAKQANYI